MSEESPTDIPASPAAPAAGATPEAEAPLAFDRAEFASAADAAPACSLCKRDLGEVYFTINAAVGCDDCHHLLATQVKESKQLGAFVRAAGLGAAAAIGGSIAWYAVAAITHMEIGLLAIAVGYVVGKAVRHGARGPGGRRYQALAMLLTYVSITGSYVPVVVKSLTQHDPTAAATAGAKAASSADAVVVGDPSAPSLAPASAGSASSPSTSHAPAKTTAAKTVLTGVVLVIAVVCVSLVAPFLSGASNIMGLVLIGIALYEAWKFNRPVPLVLDGPLRTNKVRGDASARPPGA